MKHGEETQLLEAIYEDIKPYLRAEGIAAIEAQGCFEKDRDGEYVTPLVKGEECAYVVFEKGVAKCGIEAAWNDGAVSFRKPISCHLYPVRVNSYKDYQAVNYHKWSICASACSLGEHLKTPVYEFVKDALIRKFGADWFEELEAIARHFDKGKK